MKRDRVARLLYVIILSALLILIPAPAPITSSRASFLLQFTSSGHALGFAAVADAAPSDPTRAAPISRVTYPNLWRGISLTYDAPDGTILRSTYRLEPFADAAQIRLRYNAPVQIESDGTLAIVYPTGAMRESAPIAWQERDRTREPVVVAFQTSKVSETLRHAQGSIL